MIALLTLRPAARGVSSATAFAAVVALLLHCGGRIAPSESTSTDAGAGACGGDCLVDPGTFCASGAVGCYCPGGDAPQSADPGLSCGAGTRSGNGVEYCCTGKGK